MRHPLESKLAQLRRRAREVVVAKAAARALLLVLAAATLLGIADALIHFQDRGLRAICSLGLLACCAAGASWIVAAIRASRYSDVQIAQQVERRFPSLRGRLASAVDFLKQSEDDPLAGSPQLRRATVLEVAPVAEALDWRSALNYRDARRIVIVAGCALAAVSLAAAADPGAARTALLRLVNPLNDVQWPRVNQLAIVSPVLRLPLGQTFEIQVIDVAGAPLPGDATIRFRYEDAAGDVTEEAEPMQMIGAALVARRDGVERPFEYRAVGGDDHAMSWTRLEIVQPPCVRDASVTLHFPDYTGWESQSSDLNLRALVGTKVEIEATATKSLQAAAACLEGDVTVPAAIGKDGLSFTIPTDSEHAFTVSGPAAYTFDLEDREGFHSAAGPKYEIRAAVDAEPTSEIREPKANIFVTADATLPIVILAHDDLVIRRIALLYLRSDQSDQGEQAVELVTLGDRVSADLARASAAENYAGDRHELEHNWELKPLGLPVGAQLTFHASAEDYAGQTGDSLPRRLTIVTPEEVQDRLADRQAVIFNELSRVLELEQKARSHVAGLEVQLDKTGALAKSDVDVLQGAGLNQQQVERELTSDDEGLRGQIADFLSELKINRVDGPDTGRQMQDILDEFDRLGQAALPTAARELTAAAKAAQVDLQDAGDEPAKSSAAVGASIRAAGAAQDEVVMALERMLDEMKQWVNYSHFHREIGQLSKAQEEIVADTSAAGRRTLTRSFNDLNPQERADLERLAQRQYELARRMSRLEQGMEDMASTVRQEDPLAADTVNDALDHARAAGIAEAMRSSGEQVEQNRLGQAHDRQQKVASDLRELLDILSNRREHELGRLVKKLREAEERLARLSERQQGLHKKMAAAQQLAEPEQRRELERLSRQERSLAEEAERFARSLERLQAEKASARAARASGKMGGAADKSSAGDGSAGAEEAADAQRDLEEAQQELAEARKQAEADLADEQMARMEDWIGSIQKREQNLIQETTHYQQLEAERGHLSRAESLSVRDLAREQSALREESLELAKTLAAAEVFKFVLDSASQDMERAGERLERRDVGEETVRIETRALARIEQIIAALKQDLVPAVEKSNGQGEDGGSGGGKSGGDQPPGGRSVAELKLLKLVQEQINARTIALDEARRDAVSLSEEQQTEYAQLSEEQGRLADLIANMQQVSAEIPEDNPEGLPDIREKAPGATAPGAGEEDGP
jgi:hypothetical protein